MECVDVDLIHELCNTCRSVSAKELLSRIHVPDITVIWVEGKSTAQGVVYYVVS